RDLSNRSIVVVGNYECGPISAVPCRAKTRPLRPRRSYFAPPANFPPPALVGAPGTAPRAHGFIATAAFRHSRGTPALRNISTEGYRRKSGNLLCKYVVMRRENLPAGTLGVATLPKPRRGSQEWCRRDGGSTLNAFGQRGSKSSV